MILGGAMPFGGWELGATVRVLSGHTDIIWSVVPVDSAGAGVMLWTTSSDRTIRRWDPVVGTQIGASIPYPEGFPGRLVPVTDRTGQRLLLHVVAKEADDGFGTAVPVVRYFDPTTATELRPPLSVRPGPSGHPICQVNLPDGRVTIATGRDSGVQLWDLDSGAPVGPMLTFPGQFETATSMWTLDSGGNTVLVVCRSRGDIGRYDVASILAGTWTGTQTKLTGLAPVDAVPVPLPDGGPGWPSEVSGADRTRTRTLWRTGCTCSTRRRCNRSDRTSSCPPRSKPWPASRCGTAGT
jgi:WD40 repeat protein